MPQPQTEGDRGAPSLRIVHVGIDNLRESVDGMARYVWCVAREQAAAGHDVTVLMPSDLWRQAAADVADEGVRVEALVGPVGTRSAWSIARSRPDVVHIHGVWRPSTGVLGVSMRAAGVAYVCTPHGALNAVIMASSRLQRAVYCALAARRVVHGAVAVTACIEAEVAEIKLFLGRRSSVVPVPVVVPPIEVAAGAGTWPSESAASRRIVYLGRLDVAHKGIDRLAAIGAALPDTQIALHGVIVPEVEEEVGAIRRTATPNVHFGEPIFGEEKLRALLSAALYVQPSRWEGFSFSLGEAMLLGVPCAISASLPLAAEFRSGDLGLLLPDDPAEAAALVDRALGDPETLRRWSANGRRFAESRFSPSAAAAQLADIYRQGGRRRRLRKQ